MIEVITKLTYKDPNENKKIIFEISYATVIKLKDKNCKKRRIRKNYTYVMFKKKFILNLKKFFDQNY